MGGCVVCVTWIPSCLGMQDNSLEYLQNIWEMYWKDYQNLSWKKIYRIREAVLADKNYFLVFLNALWATI